MKARSGQNNLFLLLIFIHFDSQLDIFLSVVRIKSIKNLFYHVPELILSTS